MNPQFASRPDAGDVRHHGVLHRRQHLPVEVVQQRDRHEQDDDQPRRAGAPWKRMLSARRHYSIVPGVQLQTSWRRTPGRTSPLGITHNLFQRTHGTVTGGWQLATRPQTIYR